MGSPRAGPSRSAVHDRVTFRVTPKRFCHLPRELGRSTVARKPKESEAREMMAAYYQAHKAELPEAVRKHRELIVELIMEGISPTQAFRQVLANG